MARHETDEAEDKALYGTYVNIQCNQDDDQITKIEAIREAVSLLIADMEQWNYKLDLNTMQFIVHEGLVYDGGQSFYEPPDDGIRNSHYCITVGIKCEGYANMIN